MRSRIIGSGFALGENLITNQDLAGMMDTTDEWIRERTGIEKRYYVEHGTTTSDLGVRAAEAALKDAGVAKDEVDYVVFATMTPDYYFPGCGGLLQHKLGLRDVPALDIRQQCTGFLYGLSVADAMLKSGHARTVLLVGAEVHSGFILWKEWEYLFHRSEVGPTPEAKAFNSSFRDRAVLFGDAAGAVVLRADAATEASGRGLLQFTLHSDGEHFRDLYVNTGGMAYRPYMTEEHLRESRPMPVMNGRSVYRLALKSLPQVIHEACAKQGKTVDDLKLIIPHQANLRINEALARALKVPEDKIFNNIQKYGNTTAASIPLAYHEAVKSGAVQEGDLVCFAGLGAGFHWGAVLMRQ
ncbi:MAG TPA: beta-ketoacyl-ACP synthase III [Myxococcales bacterium]